MKIVESYKDCRKRAMSSNFNSVDRINEKGSRTTSHIDLTNWQGTASGLNKEK